MRASPSSRTLVEKQRRVYCETAGFRGLRAWILEACCKRGRRKDSEGFRICFGDAWNGSKAEGSVHCSLGFQDLWASEFWGLRFSVYPSRRRGEGKREGRVEEVTRHAEALAA